MRSLFLEVVFGPMPSMTAWVKSGSNLWVLVVGTESGAALMRLALTVAPLVAIVISCLVWCCHDMVVNRNFEGDNHNVER